MVSCSLRRQVFLPLKVSITGISRAGHCETFLLTSWNSNPEEKELNAPKRRKFLPSAINL